MFVATKNEEITLDQNKIKNGKEKQLNSLYN